MKRCRPSPLLPKSAMRLLLEHISKTGVALSAIDERAAPKHVFTKKLIGPDLVAGIAKDEIADRTGILGHVGQDSVLLIRSDGEFFAIEPTCPHYHGPLIEGLVTGGTIRCPWHHACFDLRTGEALRAPAFDPLRRWNVSVRGNLVFVGARQEPVPSIRSAGPISDHRAAMVIVGGGAAGLSAAEMMRRQGFDRRIVMLSADDAPPVDRPNLSKDYLAGTVPEDTRLPATFRILFRELHRLTAQHGSHSAGYSLARDKRLYGGTHCVRSVALGDRR